MLTSRVVEADDVVQDEVLDSRLRGIWFRRFGRELDLRHSLLTTGGNASSTSAMRGARAEGSRRLGAWGLSSMCLRGRDVRDMF